MAISALIEPGAMIYSPACNSFNADDNKPLAISSQEEKLNIVNFPGLFDRIKEVLGTDIQKEIADMVGVKPPSVFKWKRDEKISVENLLAISKLSGVSINWLLTGEGPKYLQNKTEDSIENLNSSNETADRSVRAVSIRDFKDLKRRLGIIESAFARERMRRLKDDIDWQEFLPKLKALNVEPLEALEVYELLEEGKSIEEVASELNLEVSNAKQIADCFLEAASSQHAETKCPEESNDPPGEDSTKGSESSG